MHIMTESRCVCSELDEALDQSVNLNVRHTRHICEPFASHQIDCDHIIRYFENWIRTFEYVCTIYQSLIP